MWKHSNVLAMRNIFLAVVLVMAFPMPSTSAKEFLFGEPIFGQMPNLQVWVWDRGEDQGVPGLMFHHRTGSAITISMAEVMCVTCAQDSRPRQELAKGARIRLHSYGDDDEDDEPQSTDPMRGYFYAQTIGRRPPSWATTGLMEEFGPGTLRGDHMREQCKLTEELRVAKLVDRQSAAKRAIETAESAIASAQAVLSRLDLPACGCDDMLLRDYGEDRPRNFTGPWLHGEWKPRNGGGRWDLMNLSEHPAWEGCTKDQYFIAWKAIGIVINSRHGQPSEVCYEGDIFLPHRFAEIPVKDITGREGNRSPEEVLGRCVRHAGRKDPITMACMRCGGDEAGIRTEKVKLMKDIHQNNELLYAAKKEKNELDKALDGIAATRSNNNAPVT